MTDDSNPSGWPDTTRPGWPLNPERDGPHWVGVVIHDWSAVLQKWVSWSGLSPEAAAKRNVRYLGPVLTPAEIAAQVAAARAAETMRCAAIAGGYASVPKGYMPVDPQRAQEQASREIAAAILAGSTP